MRTGVSDKWGDATVVVLVRSLKDPGSGSTMARHRWRFQLCWGSPGHAEHSSSRLKGQPDAQPCWFEDCSTGRRRAGSMSSRIFACLQALISDPSHGASPITIDRAQRKTDAPHIAQACRICSMILPLQC